jgi:hypothetical protein
MDAAETVRQQKGLEPLRLTTETAVEILRKSVWDALIRAFLVQILGGIAISMVGHVFREMAPSAPPIGLRPEKITWSPIPHGVTTFLAHNQFWIIFAVLYVAITAIRFAGYLQDPKHRKFAAVVLRINRRLTSHWFSLFVFNALAAWISMMVIMALQRFSWTQILWSWISGVVLPVLQFIASLIPGSGTFDRWYSWYGQNHGKFLFWLLYSAAICDDLGLPNYKALIRWGGRRIKRYIRAHWMPHASITPIPENSPSQKAP